jgi:hypothetical protein
MPAATSAPERDHEDDECDREREQTRLPQVVLVLGHDRVDGARVAELADEDASMGTLHVVDGCEHRVDLVGGLVGITADLELDESRMPVRCDLAGVRGIERRLHVLDDLQLRDPRHDVRDRGLEGRIGHGQRVALDEDVLARRLLEAGVEDPVHAAGLAGPRRVRIDHLGTDCAAEREGDQDEGQPAERGRLPMTRTPATHAGRQVVISVRVAGHARSPS